VNETPPRHERGILDTNLLILLPRIGNPAVLPAEPLITAITLAELSVGPLLAQTDQERAARQAHLQQAEADFDPLPFDATAARVFGRVAASLHRSGRKPTARSYDAMIAATAIANGLALFTSNPDDFMGIDDLTVVPVPVPVPAPTAPPPAERPHRTGERRGNIKHPARRRIRRR
jgi:predicted nucleic acid-binding protein